MRSILLAITFVLIGKINAQTDKAWTLNECIIHALENNISIKQSKLDKESAAQNAILAKWNFFPNLNSSVSQSYNFGSSISVDGSRSSADFRSNNFGLNSSVTLFNGFANVHTLKQAQVGVEVQTALLEKLKNDISLNVANAYLQVLFAKEQLRIATSQVQISNQEVKRTEALVQEGVLPEGDFLNIRSVLATDNQNLVVAQNNYTIATMRLAQLLQLSDGDITVEEMEVSLEDQKVLNTKVSQIYEKATDFFPEIKAAAWNIKSAEERIKISKANFYPSLNLSFGLNTVYQHRQGFTDIFKFSDQLDNNFGQSFILSMNIPIFNKYQFRVNTNNEEINYERSKNNMEVEKLKLKETIQLAHADALAASKAYDASTLSIEAQEKAFEYARERFREGAINAFDFNQVKNTLLTAQSQLIRAKYDFMFKLKVLEFYYGIPL